jgi:hypothetical protein
MKPRGWKQGDPISASRLNGTNAEAGRPRRQSSTGTGSSMVNETMGNQSHAAYEAGTRLVIAKEDFGPLDVSTDIYGVNDPQYSGKCMMMRLVSSGNAPSGLYEEEFFSREFRVWDPIALLSSTASKSEGDIFYTVYNKDSKRWEVLPIGSGSQRIWFTIVSVECVSETEVILTVLPTHYTGGCTAAIPGEDHYGYVIVEDVCSILLFYTADWLVGKTGAATYMYPRSGYCVPLWLVDTICGTPECA